MQTYQELMIEAEMSASRFEIKKDKADNRFWRTRYLGLNLDAPLTYEKLVILELVGIKINAISQDIITEFRKFQWLGLNTS